MSEGPVDEPFRSVTKRVQDAYDQAAGELKEKVQKSKVAALKKISG